MNTISPPILSPLILFFLLSEQSSTLEVCNRIELSRLSWMILSDELFRYIMSLQCNSQALFVTR